MKAAIDWLLRKRADTYLPFAILAVVWMWPRQDKWAIVMYAGGAALLLAGGFLRFWASRYCGKRTGHGAEPRLATTGPYAMCRNPLYLANLTIATGFLLLAHLWWAVVPFWIWGLWCHSRTIRREEASLKKRFGQTYLEYKSQTTRWFPRIIKALRGKKEPLYGWGDVLRREAGAMVACLAGAALIVFKNLYIVPKLTF